MNGFVQYPKEFLKEAFALVRERGGVCIADEVSGYARINLVREEQARYRMGDLFKPSLVFQAESKSMDSEVWPLTS